MKNLKVDFPFFSMLFDDSWLIYLDNAATTQKPNNVIEAELSFYKDLNAAVHRSTHALGERATEAYELARNTVAQYIGAYSHEVVFTRGTTEGINALAIMWGMEYLKAGDAIVLTQLEHHANLLPWQNVATKTGATLEFIPIDKQGTLNMESLDSIITSKTKFVSVTHVSNVLGTHIAIEAIIKRAHAVGAVVLIDAAQSVAHQSIDVHALNADFLVFSGHKMYGPTGIGVLYIKESLHDMIEPYHRGGTMVHTVDWYNATWARPPHKFEAGTPPIAQAIGLSAACKYLEQNVNFDDLREHESRLCLLAIERLSLLPMVKLYGPLEQLKQSGHMINFTIDGIHAHDVAAFLDMRGIAVRAGNHCAQPLSNVLGVSASVRASFALYTQEDEVIQLCDRIEELCRDKR